MLAHCNLGHRANLLQIIFAVSSFLNFLLNAITPPAIRGLTKVICLPFRPARCDLRRPNFLLIRITMLQSYFPLPGVNPSDRQHFCAGRVAPSCKILGFAQPVGLEYPGAGSLCSN